MPRTKKDTKAALIEEESEDETPVPTVPKSRRRQTKKTTDDAEEKPRRRTAKAAPAKETAVAEEKPKPKRRIKKPAKTVDSDGEEIVKPKRKPTAYNLFVKAQMAEMKDMEGVTHKEKFKLAAERWKDAPENPKNQAQTQEASA